MALVVVKQGARRILAGFLRCGCAAHGLGDYRRRMRAAVNRTDPGPGALVAAAWPFPQRQAYVVPILLCSRPKSSLLRPEKQQQT